MVYRVDPSGHEKVLYSFGGGADGADPAGGHIADESGNLFGTTRGGVNCTEDQSGCGVVFELAASGAYTVLYSFAGRSDGQWPTGNLARDSAGNLYGTTQSGGGSGQCYAGCGTVFEISANGVESILYAFTGESDGGEPQAGVTLGAGGVLYGTTSIAGEGIEGTVFMVKGSTESVVFGFPEGTDGSQPQAGVVLDSSGKLYGATVRGGALNEGAIYEENEAGQETLLYSFPSADYVGEPGGPPTGGVVLDAAGNLYGTAGDSYEHDLGWLSKIDPSGSESVLYTFTDR